MPIMVVHFFTFKLALLCTVVGCGVLAIVVIVASGGLREDKAEGEDKV